MLCTLYRRCDVERIFVGMGILLLNENPYGESVNGHRLSPFVNRHRLMELGRVLLLPIRGGL